VRVNTAQVIVLDRGRPARKRAAGAQFFWSWLPFPFCALRSFAGRTPAVPDNHLTGCTWTCLRH